MIARKMTLAFFPSLRFWKIPIDPQQNRSRDRRLPRNLLSKAKGFADQQVEIVAPRSVVVDRHAQAMFAMNRRVREGGDSLFLQPQHDLGIERLQPVRGPLPSGR